MSSLVVGVADCQISSDREGTLITYALGSCIAVAIHDAAAGVAGLLHFMLPESSIDKVKAQSHPYMFADTGIPMLFHNAYEHGAEKRRMTVRLAGGAQVMDDSGVFNIGKRNYLAVKRILWKAGVLIHGEAIGGENARTVRLEVGTGKFWLRSGGQPEQEMPVARANWKGATDGLLRDDRG